MARRIVKRETTETTAAPAQTRTERRDDFAVNKVEDFIWFLIAVVEVLILIRFILLLFGARTGVPFVDFWYNLTAPVIRPFAGMFGNINTYNTYTGQRIELEALVAMLVYGLIGYLVILGIRLLRRNPDEREV